MTLDHALLAMFCILMILNVIALVRHHLMMQAMIANLDTFIEQQRRIGKFLEKNKVGPVDGATVLRDIDHAS